MKALFIASVLSLVFIQSAKADIISCSFTEPFYSTEYSMAQQSLTIREDVDNKVTVIKDVSFQIKGPSTFDLVGKDGKVIQELRLTNKGSDGMSDATYPYEVLWTGMGSGANNGIGGCESNYLKRVNSDNK